MLRPCAPPGIWATGPARPGQGPHRPCRGAAADRGLPGRGRALEEALAISRELGNHAGEVQTLNETGILDRTRGDLRQAESCHQQALDLARQIGSARDEAHALAGLGRCALADGRTAEAEDRLRQALETFLGIGAAETADLAAELEAVQAGAHPAPDESAE